MSRSSPLGTPRQSDDGADLNILPEAAFKAVLGVPPPEQQVLEDQAFADRIRNAPDVASVHDSGYDSGALRLAKYFLLTIEADEANKNLDGWELFDKTIALYPDKHDAGLFAGMTGFMVGWAANAARKVAGLSPVQNSAIVEISL